MALIIPAAITGYLILKSQSLKAMDYQQFLFLYFIGFQPIGDLFS